MRDCLQTTSDPIANNSVAYRFCNNEPEPRSTAVRVHQLVGDATRARRPSTPAYDPFVVISARDSLL